MEQLRLENILAYCQVMAEATAAGSQDPLAQLAEMRAIVAAAQDALKVIDPLAIQEAEKYHEKTFEHGGLTFTRTDGKRAFKYDHLKEWADAKKTLTTIEERAKNAAMQMEKNMILAGEDGEVFEPAIITYGKPSISIVK